MLRTRDPCLVFVVLQQRRDLWEAQRAEERQLIMGTPLAVRTRKRRAKAEAQRPQLTLAFLRDLRLRKEGSGKGLVL